MKINLDDDSKHLLKGYASKLQTELQFKVSLEQALNRLIKITLGVNDGNTD